MAEASDAADLGPRPTTRSGFKFDDVLRHELGIIAARRGALDTERGDLASSGPPPSEAPLATAWDARLLGVAFSGGGIRSATLNLGVLQGLARSGLLRYVDYLSTVSGGGYIGSWLTALSQRRFARNPTDAQRAGVATDSLLSFDREGFKSFERGLAWSAGDRGRDGPEREDRAIKFLREFSNFLTPKLGMFSGDTWALIAIYLRNALLNQLVLLLALVGVLLVPRLLSPYLASAEAGSAPEFRAWMAAVLVVLVLACWNLGKNLSAVTALRSRSAEDSPRVIRGIGIPLLLLGISGASWLGYLGTALANLVPGDGPVSPADSGTWAAAAVVGALLNLLTWVLALTSARVYSAAWGDIERAFWKRIVSYSLVSGAVFGVLLHAAGLWLFADAEVYSGFKLLAAPPAFALAVLIAGVLHLGLAGKNVSAQYTEWISRFGGLMLIGSFGWIAFNGLVLLGPLLVAWLSGLWETAVSSGWLLTTFVSVFFGRNVVASSGKLPRLFMQVAPWVFIVGLGVALAALLQAGLHLGVTRYGTATEQTAALVTQQAFYGALDSGEPAARFMSEYGRWLQATELPWLVAIAIALALLLTWRVSLRIDINVFSLNGMYANRLVRCYLGASVPDRAPNPFSGLSSRDDLQLRADARSVGPVNMLVHPLADGATAGDAPGAEKPTVYPGPYHLINTAINLVAGGNLAYQERKAGPFLLSPLYCGFQLDSSSSEGARGKVIDAYRPTAEFSSEPRRLTLGEAVATSGAAASPNMGYHSTPAFAFLMGVFNIRLGRWVGNPYSERQGEKTWLKSGPGVALFHLLREVFGLTDKDSGFVYLSDGGHFENLGIYELVRRRCRYIIACDAGADERYGFEDLGNAIRKCRTDLGVEIDLDVRQVAAVDAQRYNGAPCAIGSIRYSEEHVGTILYIKSSRRAGLPSDVMHYASEHLAFPHESTADQFFSESQFESYRRLGHFLAGEILSSRAITRDGVDVDQLFRDLSERWYRPSTAIGANFGRLADEVDQLFERLRTSKELAFLSRQFYPEWRNLLGDSVIDPAVQAADLVFVPRDEEELRQGFYFCSSLIQLMESVYVGLNLDSEWRHPDNSGWLNVFNHWAWSGMFRVTWAVTAATYGGRFRSFCEQRLNLDLGVVHVEPVLSGARGANQLGGSGLNRHEQRQVAALIGERADADTEVFRLELHVRHPIADEGAPPLMSFGFGYAVLRGNRLLMYRVQDHLRGMGLGRKGLVALVRHRRRERLEFGSADADKLLEFFAQFHEQTDRAKLGDFRAMVVSVNEETAAS